MNLGEYIQTRESSPRECASLEVAGAHFEVIGSLIASRLAAGLTIGELASRSGVHEAEIVDIEGGRLSPTEVTLARLQTALRRAAGDV